VDEAVADPAPDRNEQRRTRPGRGRMVGANTAVAGLAGGPRCGRALAEVLERTWTILRVRAGKYTVVI
jgi:hypothetical protein